MIENYKFLIYKNRKNKVGININLQAFAEADKTEKATAKKKENARKKGQVLKSREITAILVLVFIFFALNLFGKTIIEEILGFMKDVLNNYPSLNDGMTMNVLSKLGARTMLLLIKTLLPILLIALIVGVAAEYVQIGFLFTLETLGVKIERINPLKGMKRIFSLRSLFELIKSIIKITVVGYVAYSYIKGQADSVFSLMSMNATQTAVFVGQITMNLVFRICLALVFIALLDYLYQWWDYEKSLRMTKQEVKEEYKQVEGNPEIKSKIKQKQRQMSLRRMIQEVPKADVVITNPTHFAVAIKYDSTVSDAPVVLAKGQDYLAQRIKQVAKENNVQIVENKPLARTLYDSVEIGHAIPPDLYQAVAEVLAFVYSIKGKAV